MASNLGGMPNFLAKLKLSKKIIFIASLLLAFFIFWLWSGKITRDLFNAYQSRESVVMEDRNEEIIQIQPNQDGFYAEYIEETPNKLENLLLKKEDQYFYYHLGLNPVSTISAAWDKLIGTKVRASSTITQQLVKVLLNHEKDRNIKNKIQEIIYAVGLELHLSKEEILKMYLNSIYLGNQTQGIKLASQLYFNSSPETLNEAQILQLLATISSPSTSNPFLLKNLEKAKKLAEKIELLEIDIPEFSSKENQKQKEDFQNYTHKESAFELNSLKINCEQNCQLTIDNQLSEKIREISSEALTSLRSKNAKHSAVIVIKFPENEVLSIIGSPNPESQTAGNQINMASQNRPIGSTVKPFIYTKAFEKNLRPYTIVEDKEYKYATVDGFAFYPKNYDYKYRGMVNLHYALSNSLNIPSVKVLEFVGLKNFYEFLEKDLEFSPVQSLEKYQLGIALGQLEMSLLQLSHYFSLFANEGELLPLSIAENKTLFDLNKKIFQPQYVQLVNQILTDRKTGSEQFGLLSNLNTPSKNVALKTGTSRAYHDSWVIGYTPDFLVAVWVGNAENTPMQGVSGQVGAGKIWHEVMNLLLNSEYNQNSEFKTDLLTEFPDGENLEFGLKNDDFDELKNILIDQEKKLITEPHDGDIFLLDENTKIILRARENVQWLQDDEFWQEGEEVTFIPQKAGKFVFRAVTEDGEEEEIEIYLDLP